MPVILRMKNDGMEFSETPALIMAVLNNGSHCLHRGSEQVERFDGMDCTIVMYILLVPG